MDIACPECGESENLSGSPSGDTIRLTCGVCDCVWNRNPVPSCQQCGGTGMRAVPLAIVEKSRGTQLSVVGTRTIHLCETCDAAAIERWHRNRPNPLMPDELPTVGKVGEE